MEETRAFGGGPYGEAVRLSLMVDGPVLLLLWRPTHSWPRGAAPFNWHWSRA
jgi:hypothetical protein